MFLYKGVFYKKRWGFTLLEAIIVFVVIGIICGAGLSHYSGVSNDYSIKTASDKLQVFLNTCKHRAISYNQHLTINISNGHISAVDVPALSLRLNELERNFSLQGLTITPKGNFMLKDMEIEELVLPIQLGSQKTFPLNIRL